MPPQQKPGRSKQDYQTPAPFIGAVNMLLKAPFVFDLAASEANTVVPGHYFDEECDSLTQQWSAISGWCWLNPPYADIEPWVEKAWDESQVGAHVAMLVPASVGANWWADYVDQKAYTLFLNGRLTFVGETSPYPKDCALLLYAPFLKGDGYVWDWRSY